MLQVGRSREVVRQDPLTRWVVEVDLALVRPPTVQRTSRVILMACCAHHAELDAISVATQVHQAEMPVGSRIIDWEE